MIEPSWKVLEFGCGSSSLWWAQRVAQVVSVEHDEHWATKVRAGAPQNLTVVTWTMMAASNVDTHDWQRFCGIYQDTTTKNDVLDITHGLRSSAFVAYALELTKYPKGHFDVIVIDGMARVFTAWLAAQYHMEVHLVVFDNSNRKHYNDGYRALADAGFKRIDFYGSGPVNAYEWATSIFARDFGWLAKNNEIPESQVSDIG